MRRLFRVFAIVAVLSLLRTVAPAATWDFATPYPDDDFRTKSAKAFAEAVKGASNGSLNLVVFGNGSLIPHPQIEPALHTNRIPIGLFDLSRVADTAPIFAFSSLPFLAATYVDSLRLWNAGRPVVQHLFGESGMLVLYALPSPPAALFSAREVARVSDLETAPIIVDDPWLGRLATRIGARPVEFEAIDLQRIFTGGKEAAMLTPPDAAVNVQAWRFVDNAYNVQASFPLSVVGVNRQAFYALDEQSQRALLNAAVAAQNDAWGSSIDQRNAQVAALEANKLVVQPAPPGLMEGLRKAGSAIVDEWRGTAGPDAKAILDGFGWSE